MNEGIKIRLGKKDYIVRTWWENASKTGITLSSVVNCAVHHYAKTGRYLAIASISDSDTAQAKNSEPTIRQIYLPRESVAYKWLTEKKEGGEKISSTIKRILKNSIIVSTTEVLYTEDELKSIVDMIGTEMYEQRLNNQRNVELSVPHIEPMVYQVEKIEVTPVQNITATNHKTVTREESRPKIESVAEKEDTFIQSEADMKVASWNEEDDDTDGPDLYDALLGGVGLSL